MTLTKEQKEQLIQQLSCPTLSFFSPVKLKCDDDIISLRVQQKKGLKYHVVIYINGEFKFKWLDFTEPQYEQKYLYSRKKCCLLAKTKRAILFQFGKTELNRQMKENTFTVYSAGFPNAKTAINHLCKVCKNIEIINE